MDLLSVVKKEVLVIVSLKCNCVLLTSKLLIFPPQTGLFVKYPSVKSSVNCVNPTCQHVARIKSNMHFLIFRKYSIFED